MANAGALRVDLERTGIFATTPWDLHPRLMHVVPSALKIVEKCNCEPHASGYEATAHTDTLAPRPKRTHFSKPTIAMMPSETAVTATHDTQSTGAVWNMRFMNGR
jgi:hypothetical protein